MSDVHSPSIPCEHEWGEGSNPMGWVGELVGVSEPVIKLVTGKRKYEKMKTIVVDKTVQEIPKSVQPVFPYAEQTMDLETTFRTRMQALSSPEFVNFLRPVFQEDELKLIFVGAALGMMAGIGQLVFIFG